jgi:hypothetical protein
MNAVFSIVASLLLLGCQQPAGRWEALSDVRVFEEANDADKLKFILSKGEICSLGREQIAKAFMYREIRCAQGTGWVIYEGGYPFKELE